MIIDFIRSLGFRVSEGSFTEPSFLPGVLIREGSIIYDPTAEFYPGDLLHEAGHLAILPPDKRHALIGNVTDTFPEHAGGEMAVILWSWLAAGHLSIHPAIVFHPHGYKDQSEWLLREFEQGRYIGLPLLEWMGMVRLGEDGKPEVLSWLRR